MPFDLGFPAHQFDYKEPGMRGYSLQQFFARFPTEAACRDHAFQVRFGADPECRRCGRKGPVRRCDNSRLYIFSCGHSVSPQTNTVLHSTLAPVHLWFYAMLHFANTAEGVNSGFLGRQLGWGRVARYRIARRIRLHMARIDDGVRLGGPDQPVRVRLESLRRIKTPGSRWNATTVLTLGDGRRVVCVVVPYPKARRLDAAVADKLAEGAVLATDCPMTAHAFSQYGRRKSPVVFPSQGIRDMGFSEAGFLLQFRQALAFQFRRVDERYLWLYLKEFEFRYNRRARSHEIFSDLVGNLPTLTKECVNAMEARHFIAPTR